MPHLFILRGELRHFFHMHFASPTERRQKRKEALKFGAERLQYTSRVALR